MTVTPVIGLEVHVELKTKSKMFCGCSAEHFHIEPNTHTCPVCLGLPGALPVPNRSACEWCIKLGLALGCSINLDTFFERKNYFYPDLPKGYQITQYLKPFAVNGKLDFNGKTVRINRVHQEEDTGKSVHQTVDGQDSTLLDFNRSGVPLVEIVTEPDLNSPEDTKEFLTTLQLLIRYTGVSDADIDKGSMRCEPTVNLKIEEKGRTYYTPLVEIKNVASLTGVLKAVEYEINRQQQQWQQDGLLKEAYNKTTRGWDADKGETFLQRAKEDPDEYRYFPEPDIPPIEFTQAEVNQIRADLPESPAAKLNRYQQDYTLSAYDAGRLSGDYDTALIFEAIVGHISNKKTDLSKFAKFTANLITGPISTYLNENQKNISHLRLGPKYFWDLYQAVESGQLSLTAARQVIIPAYLEEINPLDLARNRGLIQQSGPAEIEKLARQIITDNPAAAANYQKNPAVLAFLMGQLMKASGGSANPRLASEILKKLLKTKV